MPSKNPITSVAATLHQSSAVKSQFPGHGTGNARQQAPLKSSTKSITATLYQPTAVKCLTKPVFGRSTGGRAPTPRLSSHPTLHRPLRKSWEAEGWGLGRGGGSLSPERFLLPSPVFPPQLPYPRTARYSASLRPSWLQTKRSSSESGDAAGADSTGRLPVLWNDESAAMGETAAR